MSRKSKAYRAAGEHLAEVEDYRATLAPAMLEKWILERIERHREVWDIIWKAGRKAEWVRSQEDQEVLLARVRDLLLKLEQAELNLEQAIQTSKNRGDRISYLERELATHNEIVRTNQARSVKYMGLNSDLRQENEQLKKDLVEAKLGARLYDQVERENRHNENALELAEEELVRLREQLAREKTNHHQTRATLKASADKRNELLRRALAAEGSLASGPRIPTKPEGDGWNLSWVKMTGETITGTVTTNVSATENVTTRALTRLCTGRRGVHRCVNQGPTNGIHSSEHRCHCGMLWGLGE